MAQTKVKTVFYNLLANNLVASVTNFFIWFALTFWVFLKTESILATSLIAGTYAVINALTALMFGAIVDHTKKKSVMILSSVVSLATYIIGAGIYFSNTEAAFIAAQSPTLWIFIVVLMIGCVTGNLRTIAIVPCVSILFPSEERDKANGLVGVAGGLSFGITSVLSGVVIGFFNMGVALLMGIILTFIALVHMFFIRIPEKDIIHLETTETKGRVDLSGTLSMIRQTPGLFAFIIFTTFNNFLGGIFMALMDAYGLSLMSVETWGLLFGFMSFAFIGGGIIVTKYGLSNNPLRIFFLINMITWISCIFFTIQPSIILLASGMFIWMICTPILEACESTIIQKIIPLERQGRVVGFGQSLESAVMPITTFLIGPFTHFIVVPFMTTGIGALLLGSWFGTGQARAIALVFTISGIIGLLITLYAMYSKSTRQLSATYSHSR